MTSAELRRDKPLLWTAIMMQGLYLDARRQTMVFTTNKKPVAFMDTTYLEYCCQILEERMEYPTDQLVVLLVRTQQLSQSISTTLASRNTQDSLPLSLIVQSFQHEIRQLKNTIPESFNNYSALKTQIHIAEILLYEAGLSEDLSAGLAPTDRLELLWQCLNATRSMLEARFETKFDGWPRSIVLASFDYTYAMLICLKLSLLQLPGWDLRLVHKELNFDKYLMKQIVDLGKFTSQRRKKTTPGRSEFQDPFVHLQTRLVQLRVSIMAELSASQPPESQQPQDTNKAAHDASLIDEAVTVPDYMTTFGETLPDEAAQALDDPFWQDWTKSNEWESSFSVILGWGADDASGGGATYASWTSNVQSH
ncbi:hypothetical protein N0V82_009476 [Gnomoniopsis sp. IMI 355080]|nr:hypothetical protein N0V82_009476 [Gnomoniopsis sp. IMI 355080]